MIAELESPFDSMYQKKYIFYQNMTKPVKWGKTILFFSLWTALPLKLLCVKVTRLLHEYSHLCISEGELLGLQPTNT